MSNNEFDVIIIGGGIIGTATGYYLLKLNQRVLLLEKDYIGAGSTGRCIGGIRAQFSTDATIKVAMESVRLFERMEQEFGFSVDWYPSGYLFLSFTEQQNKTFLNVMKIQHSFGLEIRFLEPNDIKKQFPYLNIDGVSGGAFCPTDGQADPFLVLKGYIWGMKKMGSTFLKGAEVIAIEQGRNGTFKVISHNNEQFFAPKVLNAAGPDAYNVGKMIGLELPVEPERHESLITEGLEYMKMPMIVDYRPDGCYFVQRLTGQIIGCYTPEQRVPGKNIDSTFEFLTEMPRRMIRLIPFLENLAVLRQWAGSYTMTPDGSPIVDETSVPGYYVSIAMCGHGFMLGPALGKYMAEFMVNQKWLFDMGEFAFNRNFQATAEAMK